MRNALFNPFFYIQIGMDPALVRGKKYKGDSDTEEGSNQYDEEYTKYQPATTTLPPLTPIVKSKSPEGSQESLLKFRAEVLKYQGMCLQYQASLLEKQAKTMSTEQATHYQDLRCNPKMMDHEQKYFHKISSAESKYAPMVENTKSVLNLAESKYVSNKADYESKYRPAMTEYTKKESLRAEYEARYKQYDSDRYQAKANSPIYYSDMEDQKLPKLQRSMYGQHRNEMPRSYNERDRSPLRMHPDVYQNLPSYGQQHCPTRDMYSSSLPTPETRQFTPNTTPERHLYNQPEPEVPLLKAEDGSMSPGPMDLSVRKNSPSPQLHTQAHNMPRIFFRLDQNRI